MRDRAMPSNAHDAGGRPRWGVAVSGGADSVATFHHLDRLARRSGDARPAVVHLDHELRGEDSTADARFVAGLAVRFDANLWLRRRSELEADYPGESWPANNAARYRRMRLLCYREAVAALKLEGVALGHHADDLAETMLIRLLRGSPRSGTMGLAPLRPWQSVAGVTLWRPMLGVRRDGLRAMLVRAKLPWREDASNARDVSQRNRLRRLLRDRPAAVAALLDLAAACGGAEDWWRETTPAAAGPDRWPALATPLRRRVARQWLVAEARVPQADAGPATVDRLLALLDPNGPRALDLPGGCRVARKRGKLVVVRVGSSPPAASGRGGRP